MLTLEFPETGSVTYTVTLSNPDFGNTDRINSSVVNRTARHGESLIVRDSSWPFLKTKVYNFNTQTKTVIDTLKAFLIATAGLKIKLTDQNDDEYIGLISTSENEIITTRDTCSYDVSFEFMEE